MNDDDGDNRLSTKLAMTQADRDMIVNFIQNNSAELFKIPQIRAMITLNRLSQIDDSQVKV